MSSIISDIFYGSKQNLLDNYLVNRNQYNKQSSVLQEQKTVFYTSSIQLQIRIPSSSIQKPIAYQIAAQMGTKTDETIVQLQKNSKADSFVALLSLNDLEKKDLNKYTNIKITISQGKYRNKIFGFIPIESIKALTNYPSGQKTVILQMKGKKSLGFNTVQCKIKAQFPNNNILNSQILRTENRDPSSFYDNRGKDKYQDYSVNNQSQEQIRGKLSNSFQKMNMPENIKRYYQDSTYKTHTKKRSSQNYFGGQYERVNKNEKRGNQKNDTISQFVRQIKSISVVFSRINVTRIIQNEQVVLRFKEKSFKLDQVCQFTNVTSEGLQLQIQIQNQVIGKIHASTLLLISPHLEGQLPIYSQAQKCIGTIHIASPIKNKNNKQSQQEFKETNYNKLVATSDKNKGDKKQLLCFSIEKFVMINFANELLNNESFDSSDQSKFDLFDFSKMQANNRIELVIRVNGLAYKFNQLVIKYLIDNDKVRIIQVRRKEGFFIHYFEELVQGQDKIQIEFYSNYQLISFSKHTIQKQSCFENIFVGGSTQFAYCQCGIYIKLAKLQVCEDYFRQSKIKNMFLILQSLVSGEVKLKDLSDESIKIIMNNNKKATFIETKKLMNLIQPHFSKFYSFQNSQIKHIFNHDEPHKMDDFMKLNVSLLREFIFIDSNGTSVIQKGQFQKIINFYRNQSILNDDQLMVLMENLIYTTEGTILYPFFIAGYYFYGAEPQEEQLNLKLIPQTSTEKSNQDLKNHKLVPNIFRQIASESQPFYFIQKISLSNMHLLNGMKIPNISINISKKIHYSNANPEFIIQKDINLMENIKIYNRNIATNDLSLLVQFQAIRRHSFYELQPSGKVSARIIWGR